MPYRFRKPNEPFTGLSLKTTIYLLVLLWYAFFVHDCTKLKNFCILSFLSSKIFCIQAFPEFDATSIFVGDWITTYSLWKICNFSSYVYKHQINSISKYKSFTIYHFYLYDLMFKLLLKTFLVANIIALILFDIFKP